jgi:hypothetical protein
MNRKTTARSAIGLVAVGVLLAFAVLPGVAEAHGPVAPVASSYLAKVGQTPPGFQARVIDGDQRMWLKVPSTDSAVVLDYRGAPYLRFSPSGVQVNQNSAMYYLNQTPTETPPSNLTPATRPDWASVSGGHVYSWHDGRLHALAAIALSPGMSYVGRWSIPVRLDGRLAAIRGGLWHSGAPSIMWFWPILVLLACVLAALRVRSPSLDMRVARLLAAVSLASIAVAALSRGLYGRPTVSIPQLIVPAITLGYVAWGLHRVLFRRNGYFFLFAVAFVSIWEGGLLVPTLWNGFVLAALPAFVTRATSMVCIASGAGLLMLAFALAGRSDPDPLDGDGAELEHERDDSRPRESFA